MNRAEENMKHAERPENLDLTEEDMKEALRKAINWKFSGFDRLLGTCIQE